MKFQFDIKVNDQDYLDFNIFWMTRSSYGKKQMRNFRIWIAAAIAIPFLLSLFTRGFSKENLLSFFPLLIVFLLCQLLLKKFNYWMIKVHIKSLKKSGKMGYSPESVLEFYDDCFVETMPDGKIEQKYSAIERVSIVDNKMIYIHVSNVMGYMLPMACFESIEQYAKFFDFIRTKCANIDVY